MNPTPLQSNPIARNYAFYSRAERLFLVAACLVSAYRLFTLAMTLWSAAQPASGFWAETFETYRMRVTGPLGIYMELSESWVPVSLAHSINAKDFWLVTGVSGWILRDVPVLAALFLGWQFFRQGRLTQVPYSPKAMRCLGAASLLFILVGCLQKLIMSLLLSAFVFGELAYANVFQLRYLVLGIGLFLVYKMLQHLRDISYSPQRPFTLQA